MTPIEYFYEISKIPRGSGNEEAAAKYIEGVAKAHGLFCVRDALNNVYVRKPACAGYEDKAPCLFAAHTDMVCEKLPSSMHSFLTDGIEITEKNGILRASGTTLGADDGAGVAIMLSMMTDSLSAAPETEYLFTTSEETGMNGAAGFDYSRVKSDMVVSLDAGEESSVCISCASGYSYDIKIPIERTRKCGNAVKITVSGLAGGHSGNEIDRGKQSAVKILSSLLCELYSLYPFHIADISCDGKANVIAPSAYATVFFYNKDDEKRAASAVAELEKAERALLFAEDAKKFRLSFKKLNLTDTEAISDMLTLKSSSSVISALTLMPQGVLNRFEADNTPEASVNFGIIKTEKDCVVLSCLARSASARSDKKTHLVLKRLAHTLGAVLELKSAHTAWEYRLGSFLQSSYKEAYSEIFGGEPDFYATHAGLECGIFYGKLKEQGKSPDIIAIGPNMQEIHTPKEALEKASVDRIYKTLKTLLKVICK